MAVRLHLAVLPWFQCNKTNVLGGEVLVQSDIWCGKRCHFKMDKTISGICPNAFHQVQSDAFNQVQSDAFHQVQSDAFHQVQSYAFHQAQSDTWLGKRCCFKNFRMASIVAKPF